MARTTVASLLLFLFACGGGSHDDAGPTLTAVSIEGASLPMAPSTERQLTATAEYSDGSSQDVTALSEWESLDTSVVGIPGGLAVAMMEGDAVVRAAFGGTVGEATVSVRHHRQVFVTSAEGNADLSAWEGASGTGLAAGDSICQSLATDADLPGTFRAWLSDSSTDAYCHVQGLSGTIAGGCGGAVLPGAGPWLRLDGLPFAPEIDLLVDGLVYAPAFFNEHQGAAYDLYWTGTTPAGAHEGLSCSDWSSSSESAYGWVGSTYIAGSGWTEWAPVTCGRATWPRHGLLCLEAGVGPPLPFPQLSDKKVFLTSVSGSGDLGSWPDAGAATGLAAGDAICQARAAAGGLSGTFKAWLSVPGFNAENRLTSSGPWRRLDGIPVATSKDQLVSGLRLTSINVDEFGTYLNGQNTYVFTGSSDGGLATDRDCDRWEDGTAASDASAGMPIKAGAGWSFHTFLSCEQQGRLYCFED